MTWTVIYRENEKSSSFSTKVIHGPWGRGESLAYARENTEGDVFAIIAGVQEVHFNEPVLSCLYDMRNNQKP